MNVLEIFVLRSKILKYFPPKIYTCACMSLLRVRALILMATSCSYRILNSPILRYVLHPGTLEVFHFRDISPRW